jgi:hypothetical protein
MRRVARHLFTLLSALSLLLCVATCVLWVRSIGGGDVFGVPIGSTTVLTLVSNRGALHLKRLTETETPFSGLWEGDRRPGDDRPFWEAANVSNKVWQVRWTQFPYEKGWSAQWGQFGAQRFAFQYKVNLPQTMVTVAGSKAVLAMPHWLLAALALALPSVVAIVRIRFALRKMRAGFCAHCGYDLRATPERCPECGAVPAKAV